MNCEADGLTGARARRPHAPCDPIDPGPQAPHLQLPHASLVKGSRGLPKVVLVSGGLVPDVDLAVKLTCTGRVGTTSGKSKSSQ